MDNNVQDFMDSMNAWGWSVNARIINPEDDNDLEKGIGKLKIISSWAMMK